MATKTPIDTVTVTQQALSLIRQIVAATGWAKTIDEIYRGGQLLSDVLPELDPTDWAKTPPEVAAMKPAAREAYQKRDREWVNKKIVLPLSTKQIESIKTAFNHVASTGALGPSPYLTEVIVALGLVKTDE